MKKKFNVQRDVNGIQGLCIIEPTVFEDYRGYFIEAYNEKDFFSLGLDMKFVQDNQVFSVYGVLRGMHVNRNNPQGKLIRVISGSIYDVVVDLRPGSESYKKWFGIELSASNRKQLYIPEGFAHGYLVLSEIAEVLFKVTKHYIPGDEIGILWNSPELDIKWPKLADVSYILNENDLNNKDFSELKLS